MTMLAAKQINELHAGIPDMYADLEHLRVLPRIENKLIDAATSERKPDKDVTMLVIKILGLVCFGLTMCIVFLLTGEHLGIISPLSHKEIAQEK